MIFAFKCHQSCIDCLLKKEVQQKVTLKQLKHVFGGQQGMTLTNFHRKTTPWIETAIRSSKIDLNAFDKLEKYDRWQILFLKFEFTINFTGFP